MSIGCQSADNIKKNKKTFLINKMYKCGQLCGSYDLTTG